MAPQLGRNIGSADFQGGVAPVVVVSNGFWQQHLGGDPGLVGRQLLLNGQKFTVIGIASPDFDFPTGSKVWTPLDLNGPANEDRENHYLTVFGRLKDGVSISQAQAKLDTIAARLGQQYPKTNASHGVSVKNTVEDLTFGTQQFLTDADGRSRLCSSAGLRQRCEPATGPRFRTAKRNRAAGRARGQPLAGRTAVAGGERLARSARKRGGAPAVGVGHQPYAPQPSPIYRRAHCGTETLAA